MLTNIKLYATIAIVAVLLAIGGLGMWYYHNSQAKIATLNQKVVTQAVTIETQDKAITQIRSDISSIKTIKDNLANVERLNADQTQKMNDALQKLNKVATERPGLAETIVNHAALERNRCLALVTGATLQPKETNRVCPQIIKQLSGTTIATGK